MKKFKALIQNLQETGEYGEGGSLINGFSTGVQRTAVNDKGIFYGFKNSEQLTKLNAFVNSFLGGSYIDPKEPLKELAGRLSHIGFVMKVDNNTPLVAGANQIPVKVFGDKFGVTNTTDLSVGFDHGEDYPDMALSFNLNQTMSGYVFTDIQLSSPAASVDQIGTVGTEIDNSPPKIGTPVALINPQNESVFKKVESFLLEDGNDKILDPIHSSLLNAKKKGTYTKEEALSRFDYAIYAGMRSLNENEETFDISEEEKKTLATRLLKNFEKTH